MNKHQAKALIEFADYVQTLEMEWWERNRDLPPITPPASDLGPEELIHRWSLMTSERKKANVQ